MTARIRHIKSVIAVILMVGLCVSACVQLYADTCCKQTRRVILTRTKRSSGELGIEEFGFTGSPDETQEIETAVTAAPAPRSVHATATKSVKKVKKESRLDRFIRISTDPKLRNAKPEPILETLKASGLILRELWRIVVERFQEFMRILFNPEQQR